MVYPIELKLMVISVGIFVVIVGAYFWRLAERTPKGKLVPRPFGVWWSIERTYSMAVLLWLLGLVLIIVGVIR